MLSDRVGVMSARPGRFIDLVEHIGRASATAASSSDGHSASHRAAMEHAAWGIDEGHRARVMTRAAAVRWTRIALVAGCVLLLEAVCRLHMINPLTLIPPSAMAIAMVRMIASGEMIGDIAHTFSAVAIAAVASVIAGFALGTAIYTGCRACGGPSRRCWRRITPCQSSSFIRCWWRCSD